MSKNVSLRNTIRPNDVPEQAAAIRPATPTTPPSEELVRKETRLLPEQIDEISRLRRRLNTDRKAAEQALPFEQRSAAIPDQALTRAAITFLLENADAIHGWTEADVLESLRRLKN